jgi:serine phosphatase RsbU (regulator of sigma subunit)
MNRVMCKTVPDNRFVTFFYGVLDPGSNTLTYVNAGQTPPYLVRARGGIEQLGQSGPPLGLLDDSTYRPHTLTMEPGDILICYSDGVSEASAPEGHQFGEDRLAALVAQERVRTPGEIVRVVTEAMAAHCAGHTYGDDVTLVILKRHS